MYELSDEYRRAVHNLAMSDVPDDAIADTLEGMQGAIEDKARAIAAVMKNLDHTAKGKREAGACMVVSAQAIESRREALRQSLRINMERCGLTRIPGDEFDISIKKNRGRVIIDDLDKVPAYFLNPQPSTPDKQSIYFSLINGVAIPGAHIEESTRVEVR